MVDKKRIFNRIFSLLAVNSILLPSIGVQELKALPISNFDHLEISQSLLDSEPITIAVRKVKNMAGSFAESGEIYGPNGKKINVGFWNKNVEIKLAEYISNALSDTGHFIIVERNRLYDVFNEQSIKGINPKTAIKKNNLTAAKYIVLTTLSNYVPNSSGSRSSSDSRFLVFKSGKDRAKVNTYISLDVRIVNTSTGTIEHSRTIEGITSTVAKADRSGVTLGLANNVSEKQRYDMTATSRALRAAVINVVDYLDCRLYLQDECLDEYKAMDEIRKESTKDTFDLF
ncbi:MULTISPECIES: CsgG/HfaB family protein [unclassified Prochlorococcus]|uniref:CsgG/HfaB family protein n=1 Tax=unclassified Prochlorococcus TaxID=2627481 RepID=UPI0005336FF3|nr:MULTISPECIES: CsgG/HfaB family protein [unclassified Prochlorococcus]KGG14956.1 hypothetical protein EV06_2024 [Prochlorococcus sp. MIT 0602]KGG15610.1 hypothetical protein EV07_1575 [Prochlorococcus sp. MIT 0603]